MACFGPLLRTEARLPASRRIVCRLRPKAGITARGRPDRRDAVSRRKPMNSSVKIGMILRAGVGPASRRSADSPIRHRESRNGLSPVLPGLFPDTRRKSIRCRESASAGFRICPSSRLIRIKWKRPGCLRASRSHREPERIIPACPRMSPMRPLSGATPAAVPQRKPASASRVYSLDITAGTITTSYPCLRASSAVYFFPSTVIWPPSGITYFKTIGAESILFT